MEFLHSILSSLFFFLTFIKFVSFWKENSQFLSWLNKKEILRNQKSALSPHYTPPPCHTQRSANTTPFPGGATSAQDTEGTSPSFLEFLGKLGNRAATEGQRQYLTKGGGKVVHEYQWGVRSFESTPGPWPASTSAVKAPSSTPPEGSLPRSWDWSLHLPSITGVTYLGCFTFHISMFDYKFPKLIYIN